MGRRALFRLATMLLGLLQLAPGALSALTAPAQSPRAVTTLTAPGSPESALDAGFAQLYNLKFERAEAEFERWIRENPEDPLGPACRLTVYLFRELNRLRIPQSSLLPDTHSASGAAIAAPDNRTKLAFYDQLRKTTDQAERRLAQRADDETALLALTIIYATQADYLNLVEKRAWASLTLFKKSNRFAQQLLKRNPGAYDAWAASGLTEYLASSLPFYARWFVRFDSVKGDRKAAIEQLQRAAAKGRYLRPYAKMILAGVYLQERRPAEGLRVLKELSSEFPDNILLAAELKQVSARVERP